MIRLSHLYQVVGQIGQSFLCPRCQAHYGVEHMHLISHDRKTLHITGHCPQCEAKAHINVNIDQKSQLKKGASLTNGREHFQQAIPLSDQPLELDRLKKTIKKFEGKDIRDLF